MSSPSASIGDMVLWYSIPPLKILQPHRLFVSEQAAGPYEQHGEQDRYGDRVLVRRRQDPDAEGLEDAEDEPGAHGGHAVAQAPEDGDRESLDGEAGADVVLRVGYRRHDAARQGPDPRGEHEGKGDHVFRRDAAEGRGFAVRGAGPHLPSQHRMLEEKGEQKDDD